MLPIIVALDAPWAKVKIWLKRLEGQVWGFKVGNILFTEQGPRVVEEIKRSGFHVFLDLKFHDIPSTVQGAVKQAFSWGVDCLTVHAAGGKNMLEAIANEQIKNKKILAVTVLTSLDQKDLKQIGIKSSVEKQVLELATLAVRSGIQGLVCSPQEVESLRKKFPSTFFVTPGIRLNKNTQDQKRTTSMEDALQKGADLVVLGRALTAEKNWKNTWQKVTCCLEGVSSKKL